MFASETSFKSCSHFCGFNPHEIQLPASKPLTRCRRSPDWLPPRNAPVPVVVDENHRSGADALVERAGVWLRIWDLT